MGKVSKVEKFSLRSIAKRLYEYDYPTTGGWEHEPNTVQSAYEVKAKWIHDLVVDAIDYALSDGYQALEFLKEHHGSKK